MVGRSVAAAVTPFCDRVALFAPYGRLQSRGVTTFPFPVASLTFAGIVRRTDLLPGPLWNCDPDDKIANLNCWACLTRMPSGRGGRTR
eukprot:XP_001697957.1 predicted protein [Chlamydomonas reinhardtii]